MQHIVIVAVSGISWWLFVISFLVICTFAAVTTGALYALGRRHPEAGFWEDVDLYYYPLGIVGVVLFFLANADTRNKVEMWSASHAEHVKVVTKARSAVATEFIALNDFLFRMVDVSRTCGKDTENDARFAMVCRTRGLIWALNRVLLLSPTPWFELFYAPAVTPVCTSALTIWADSSAWGKLHALRDEFTEGTRKGASEMMGRLLDACVKLSAVVSTNPQLVDPKSPTSDSIPDPGWVALIRLREWVWPIFVILALSLKVGKAKAAQVRKHRAGKV